MEKCNNQELITLDVSGSIFKTKTSTLQAIPETLLSSLNTDMDNYDPTCGRYYFDRDADMFKHILNAYRSGILHVPKDMCSRQFKDELEFWKMPIKILAPCCWETFYKMSSDMSILGFLWKRSRPCVPPAGNSTSFYKPNPVQHKDSNGEKKRDQDVANQSDKTDTISENKNNKSTNSMSAILVESLDTTPTKKQAPVKPPVAINTTRKHEVTGKDISKETEEQVGIQGKNGRADDTGADGTDIPFFRSDKDAKPVTPCKIWLFLSEPMSSTAAKIWLLFYLGIVLLNAFIILTWSEFRVEPFLKLPKKDFFNNTKVKDFLEDSPDHMLDLVNTDHHPVLFALDIACLIFFITEALVHFWACPCKRSYHKVPEHFIKIFLCICMMITLILDISKYSPNVFTPAVVNFYTLIRSISILRLTLIFQLRKLYKKLDILLLAIERSSKEFVLLVFLLLVLVIIYGTMMFSAEIQSKSFPNNWVALWWSIITMTTVGYGDFYPSTGLGYLVGTLCALNGLIVLALPIASIASNFSNFSSMQDYINNHEMMIKQQNQNNKKKKMCLKC